MRLSCQLVFLRSALLFVSALCVLAAPTRIGAQEQKSATLETGVEAQPNISYLIYKPEIPKGKELPLLVFLHGAGERGDNLERVKVHGPPKLIAQKKRDFPFIVVSPQCPQQTWWREDAVVKLVDHVIATESVDVDRVYLTGLSMGGFGTWTLAAKYPRKWAAIVPICGGGDPKTVERFRHLPTWVFHGAKDRVIPLERSTVMVDALKKIGAKPKFTVYPELDHDSWTRAYDDPELWKWIAKQKRRPQKKGGAKKPDRPSEK